MKTLKHCLLIAGALVLLFLLSSINQNHGKNSPCCPLLSNPNADINSVQGAK